MFWLIWTLLVLATAVGAFFLGRDLWRKGKALLAELGRASDVAAALSDRADQLAAAAPAPVASSDLFTDPRMHRERLETLRDERASRRELRRLRNERVARSWRAYWR